MAEQAQHAKDVAGQKAQECKEFTQQKAGEAHGHAQGGAETMKDKVVAAGQAGQEKAGAFVQKAGDAVKGAMHKVTGGGGHE